MLINTEIIKGKDLDRTQVEFHRNKYLCDWCKHEFVRDFKKRSDDKTGFGKVVCPFCRNELTITD